MIQSSSLPFLPVDDSVLTWTNLHSSTFPCFVVLGNEIKNLNPES